MPISTSNANPEKSIQDLILESTDDCIKVLDLEGRIVYMNPGGRRKLGVRDPAEVEGTFWFDFWDGKNLTKAKDAFAVAAEGGSGTFTGSLAPRGDRPKSYWNVVTKPIRDEKGKIVSILAVSREVTEQVSAQADDSRLAEDRFQLFVESVKDYALFLLDPSGTVTTWNEGARRIKGYEASEIIGSHFSRFYTAEDIARGHPAEELEIATREGRFEEEGWRVRKDGSRFWASVVISRMTDKSGNLLGFAKVTRDLTERKAAEQAKLEEQKLREREQVFDQVFAGSPSFMALLSVPGFRYLRANAQHQKLVGRNLIGKSVGEVHPESNAQNMVEILKKVVATGEPFVGREMPLPLGAPGEPHKTAYLDFVLQPVRKPGGEIYAIASQGYDVTEKVLSRRAVENERENFRNLFRQTPEIVCILKGPDHLFEFVNEAHVRALGFDATGMTVREAQPESVEVHGILDEVYRTGKTAELHEIPVTVTGRLRYFNLTYSARRNGRGEIDGVMVLGMEVTEQVNTSKELELVVAERTRELKDSESFLDSVIENIPHMVFVKDAKELRFVRFNRAGEDLLGFSRHDLLGKNDFDFFPKSQAEYFSSKDKEVLSGRSVVDIPEEAISKKSGEERILHTRKIPLLSASGEPEYLLGISEDITEWKRAEEERLRVIREQAAVAERKRETERAAFLAEASTVLASSLDYQQTLKDLARLTVPAMADWCTVTMVNEEGAKERLAAVHRDPGKAALIEELSTFYSRSNDGDSLISHVIDTGKPSFMPVVEEAALVTAARDARHLEIMRELACTSCILVPILARGKGLGAIALVSDRKSRQYNESDLALAEELARRAGIAIENASLYQSVQRAVRARDSFLSIASHELKTPLTSLKLQAQIRMRELKKGNVGRFSPENLPNLVAADEKQVNRLIRLVEDMLDVSRIHTGKLELGLEEFDLTELLQDTVSRLSSQFEAAGVELKARASGPVLGKWDHFRLEQVLVNLLTNALKYGDGKPVEVSVGRQGDLASFSVKDQGIGIQAKDQRRIFEQFERAVTSSISGLGLGLFISKKIVEAHGGSIRVESGEGQGSTFIVELPLMPPSS
jgi:PAS domain S-box-containing protein